MVRLPSAFPPPKKYTNFRTVDARGDFRPLLACAARRLDLEVAAGFDLPRCAVIVITSLF
jgi:hypothetical protein